MAPGLVDDTGHPVAERAGRPVGRDRGSRLIGASRGGPTTPGTPRERGGQLAGSTSMTRPSTGRVGMRSSGIPQVLLGHPVTTGGPAGRRGPAAAPTVIISPGQRCPVRGSPPPCRTSSKGPISRPTNRSGSKRYDVRPRPGVVVLAVQVEQHDRAGRDALATPLEVGHRPPADERRERVEPADLVGVRLGERRVARAQPRRVPGPPGPPVPGPGGALRTRCAAPSRVCTAPCPNSVLCTGPGIAPCRRTCRSS